MDYSADQFLLSCEFAEFKSSFIVEHNGCGMYSPSRTATRCQYTKFALTPQSVVEFVNHNCLIFISFNVIRPAVADKPVNCASLTKDYLVDNSNLTLIFSHFSSDSTWLLGVLFLSRMESLALILFKCLWNVFIFWRCASGKFLLNLRR
jgi:hypothetical protein